MAECFDAGDVLRCEQHVGVFAAGGAMDGFAGVHGRLAYSERVLLIQQVTTACR